jgi:hypothetical protein
MKLKPKPMTRYWLLLLCVGMFACKRVDKRYVIKVKQVRLAKDDLYNRWTAYNAIFDAEESGSDSIKNLARQYFLKAIDLYKNKKEIDAAIVQFKKSLLVFPDAKTYYELGNALVDMRAGDPFIKEAIKSYEVADYLKFQPQAMVDYRVARANSFMQDDESKSVVIGYLRQAFWKGFSDTMLLRNDASLAPYLQTEEYKTMLLDLAIKNNKGNAHSMFDIFVNSFPTLGESFSIPASEVNMDRYSNASISYDFAMFIPEMENVSFGREVSNDFFRVGKLAQTPEYTVLVYSSVSFMGELMQPVFTRIVTYSNDGKIIASRIFSSQFSAEKVRAGKYSKGEFTVEDYQRNWEQPVDKVPFEENKVKSFDLLANATFTIQPDGKIIIKEASKNYKESVAVK